VDVLALGGKVAPADVVGANVVSGAGLTFGDLWRL
jgi:hypothetical protein